VEHLWSLLHLSCSHQTTCAASTKLEITPSSEIQKMFYWLQVKLDFKNFPTMCTMEKDLSRVGSHVAAKLNNIDLPLLNITLRFWIANDGVLIYAPISISPRKWGSFRNYIS
jgi:hypothetical protein